MNDLPERLLAERKADGVALPSIRSLAAHFGVAPLTIHRALRVLQEGGRVHAVSRKGFFWGKEPIAVASLPRRSDRLAQTRERLVSDLRSGVFHPHRELPSRLALSQIYGIAPGRIGALLDELAESGTLLRRGRGFALPTPPRRAEEGTVLVVSRCDASGTLLLETERQTDFVKSVHREGRERALRIVVLGWCQDEGSGAFLNQDGVEVEPRSVPGILLGCLVSTWLVRDPRVLLGDLGKLRVPISVWWEHPPGEFPSGGSWKAPVLGFNISFGPSSGVVVGRHLRSAGTGPIAFVSPFHGGDWSRARLEGLLEGLRGTDIEIVPFVDEARASAWEHHQAEGGVAAGERRIRDILADFLELVPHIFAKVHRCVVGTYALLPEMLEAPELLLCVHIYDFAFCRRRRVGEKRGRLELEARPGAQGNECHAGKRDHHADPAGERETLVQEDDREERGKHRHGGDDEARRPGGNHDLAGIQPHVVDEKAQETEQQHHGQVAGAGQRLPRHE